MSSSKRPLRSRGHGQSQTPGLGSSGSCTTVRLSDVDGRSEAAGGKSGRGVCAGVGGGV